MTKLPHLLGLALLMLGLLSVPATQAELADPEYIYIAPGMTEFELGGESFLVITTQNICIRFDGINPQRVWGVITPLDGWNLETVKFIWLSDNYETLTLHDGILGGREWVFDSDDVTGHNEKTD